MCIVCNHEAMAHAFHVDVSTCFLVVQAGRWGGGDWSFQDGRLFVFSMQQEVSCVCLMASSNIGVSYRVRNEVHEPNSESNFFFSFFFFLSAISCEGSGEVIAITRNDSKVDRSSLSLTRQSIHGDLATLNAIVGFVSLRAIFG